MHMRLISEEEFSKYFPNGKLGQECYIEISKYVIKYIPEIDGNDGHTSYEDAITVHVKDYDEPISSQIINSFLNHFKDELGRMEVLGYVFFGNISVNDDVEQVQIKDIINNHKPVYHIRFDNLYNLKYFDCIFNEIELDSYKL